jgi:hypothetical protein
LVTGKALKVFVPGPGPTAAAGGPLGGGWMGSLSINDTIPIAFGAATLLLINSGKITHGTRAGQDQNSQCFRGLLLKIQFFRSLADKEGVA